MYRRLLALILIAGFAGTASAQLPPFILLDSNNPPGTDYTASPDAAAVGSALAGGFDLNSDGAPDMVIGAPGGPGTSGRAFIVLDRKRPPQVNLSTSDGIITVLSGNDSGPDGLGASVASPGDVDGDGIDDLLIGLPSGDRYPEGAAVLIFGRADLPPRIDLSRDLPRLGVLFRGRSAGEGAGAAVSGVGDVNGDGFPDFAIGAPSGSGPAGDRAGRVYLLFGGPVITGLKGLTAEVSLGALAPEAGLTFEGPAAGALLGSAVCGAGDLDGDGRNDLALGAPGVEPGGAFFVVFGQSPFGSPDLSSGAPRVLEATTVEQKALLGAALAGGRDVTGDGASDLLAGSPGGQDGDRPSGGAVLIAGGPGLAAAGTIDVGDHRDGVVRFRGTRGEAAGSSVALISDVDGDSLDDILIGAPRLKLDQGIVYEVNGSAGFRDQIELDELGPGAGSAFLHNGFGAGTGTAVAGLGDRDGNGFSDIAIGAPGAGGGGVAYEVLVLQGSPVAAPRDLSCKVKPGSQVLLSWINARHYRSLAVLRDGNVIATLDDDDARFFIDTDPLPGEHGYRIQADEDPKLLSNECRVVLRTLPVLDLLCGQIPGTTRVRITWELGDRYEHLAVSLNGKVIEPDLPGRSTSFEFDQGAGDFEVAVFDPGNGGDGPSGRCQVSVVPVEGSVITGFTCVLKAEDEEDTGVELSWDPNPVYDSYRVIRNDVVIEDRVNGTSLRDDDAPSGLQTYLVIGIAREIHPGPPASCSVTVPGPGPGNVVRGTVHFADPEGTPIRKGKLLVLDAASVTIGAGQPGDQGRFEIPIPAGIPALIRFTVVLPPLSDDPFGEHTVQVDVPAGAGDADVQLPLPVLAFSGLQEPADRWMPLHDRLEALVSGGLHRGTLTFGFEGRGEIGRGANAISQAVARVSSHLQSNIGAAPGVVDVIAHGFSGLGARLWLHSLEPGKTGARVLALLGTPDLGTTIAGLDAFAAEPERTGSDEDPFTAAEEQLPSYLATFNARITNLRGARVHAIAGTGGGQGVQAALECSAHDGRVCVESALGGIPGAVTHTTADIHEDLGRSSASTQLLASIVLDPRAGGGGGVGDALAGGGATVAPFESGAHVSSILGQSSSDEVDLFSDTTGSVIIILNNQLPGSIDFNVREPDGTLVTPATTGGNPGVVEYLTLGDGEGHQVQSYRFEVGQVGNYTAIITNSLGLRAVAYSLQIYLNAELTLAASLSTDEVDKGGTAVATATLVANGQPVIGATVEARVTQPDGGYVAIPMRDDGQGPDTAAGDGIYAASVGATPVAGLYLVTIRSSGLSPFPFLREEPLALTVRSDAAAFSGPWSTGTDDAAGDGILDDVWTEGTVDAKEPGIFLVLGRLIDSSDVSVAEGGLLLTLDATGPAPFRLVFSAGEIAAAGRDGPYRLVAELLDGNRGFVLCDRVPTAATTRAFKATEFGAAPPLLFIRGDANADGSVDLADSVAILSALFASAGGIDCMDAADVNADRKLDISDAIFLLDNLFLGTAKIPPPSPACGVVDGAGCPGFTGCK